MKNIILLAVQGAGKGSLARVLSDKYGYANISMGEVMRNARNDGTQRAKTIAEYQDRGELVPLKDLNKDIGVVINLTIPEELIYQRLAGRRTCKNCGKTYNIYSEKFLPKQEGVCDVCHGELYQRSDDTEEAIKKRVETYFHVTTALIDYYKKQGVLYEVPSIDIDETTAEVEKILGEHND